MVCKARLKKITYSFAYVKYKNIFNLYTTVNYAIFYIQQILLMALEVIVN